MLVMREASGKARRTVSATTGRRPVDSQLDSDRLKGFCSSPFGFSRWWGLHVTTVLDLGSLIARLVLSERSSAIEASISVSEALTWCLELGSLVDWLVLSEKSSAIEASISETEALELYWTGLSSGSEMTRWGSLEPLWEGTSVIVSSCLLAFLPLPVSR